MSVIYGTNVSNSLNGTTGRDSIYGWDATNVAGDFGPDTDDDALNGGLGNDLMDGGAGNDRLQDIDGVNTLYGGTGDDTLSGNFAAGNLVFGGSGIDVLEVGTLPAAALVFTLAAPEVETVMTGGLRVIGVERLSLFGTALGDSITGGAWDDAFLGQGGNDYLAGAGGNDYVDGGAGLDTLLGGFGNDTLSTIQNQGADSIEGGVGTDMIMIHRVTTTARYDFALKSAFVLEDGTRVSGVERLSYFGTSTVEHISGGAFDDSIDGGTGADTLEGWGGDDFLSVVSNRGASDNAVLYGGKGDDTIYSLGSLSAGEQFWGGQGIDLVIFSVPAAPAALVLSMAVGGQTYHLPGGATLGGFEQMDVGGTLFDDRITGGKYSDTLFGYDGKDLLNGGAGNDVLEGQVGNDTLNGGAGDDTLFDSDGNNLMSGGDGADRIQAFTNSSTSQFLYGGTGDDTVLGGSGADVLSGGTGRDSLTGGQGADFFDFTSAAVVGEVDAITDFTAGVDTVRLASRAFAGLRVGDLASADFVLGSAALDTSDRILYDKAKGQVWFDNDGLGGANAVMFLTVTAGTALTFADFTVI